MIFLHSRFQVRYSSTDSRGKSTKNKTDEDEYEPVTYDWNQERVPHKWYPDIKYYKAQQGPFLNYEGLDYRWKQPGWHEHLCIDTAAGTVEKKTKNVTINFGPQHPAAHGVLRLILELEGEVGLITV